MSTRDNFSSLATAYFHDLLSRLLGADYYPGANLSAAPFRDHAHGYDLAGSLVNFDGTSRTYNAANQLTSDGTNATYGTEPTAC